MQYPQENKNMKSKQNKKEKKKLLRAYLRFQCNILKKPHKPGLDSECLVPCRNRSVQQIQQGYGRFSAPSDSDFCKHLNFLSEFKNKNKCLNISDRKFKGSKNLDGTEKHPYNARKTWFAAYCVVVGMQNMWVMHLHTQRSWPQPPKHACFLTVTLPQHYNAVYKVIP